MNYKKSKQNIFLFCFLLFCISLLISCTTNSEEETKEIAQEPLISSQESSKTIVSSQESTISSEELPVSKKYVLFTLNIHDWTSPEKSIATLTQAIAIHEKYNVPLDIYLDDPIVQTYYQQDSNIFTRIKNSPIITVNYHLRPPYPYYSEFDFLGLENYSSSELQTLLLNYEEHAIDLETGMPTDAEGGYQFLKDIMGYAPVVVSGYDPSTTAGKILAQIYADKGATFVVVHGKSSVLGQKKGPLFIRPEDIEIKLYESVGQESSDVIKESITSLSNQADKGDRFINIKMHENNFYTKGYTAFDFVYYRNVREKTQILSPPWDTNAWESKVNYKSADEEDEMWQHYEDAVAYVASNTDTFETINSFHLKEMIS